MSVLETQKSRKAVVIGASVAGLLAADVLATHFGQVTIVERDSLPAGPEHRKGVPQSKHIHVLLLGGYRLLQQRFPDLERDLTAAGAATVDWGRDALTFTFGSWKPRFTSGLTSQLCSRDLLEWTIRRQVARHTNVHWLTEHDVTGLVTDENGTRLQGVRVRARAAAGESSANQDGVLPADLVVNASGRDSRVTEWLKALGYPLPRETRVNSFLGYSSRYYAPPPHWQADWKTLLVSATPPHSSRGAVILPLEQGRWLVTLAGAARDYPPTDEKEFLDFIRSLPVPAVYEALLAATPLSPISGYRRTENLRRHYEKLPRYLEGLVTLGDAACAFNPVYGQGMTVAALGAQALDECLREQRRRKPDGDLGLLARRFHRKLGETITLPWLMSTGEDFRYASTEGGRPSLGTRLLRPYLDQVALAAAQSPEIQQTFLEVVHLLEPPNALFRPNVVATVLSRLVQRSRQHPQAQTAQT